MFLPKVPYHVEGWLPKNKDPLNDSVVELFKKSSEAFVGQIWSDYLGEGMCVILLAYNICVTAVIGERPRGKGSQFITVGQRHKVCVCVCVSVSMSLCLYVSKLNLPHSCKLRPPL